VKTLKFEVSGGQTVYLDNVFFKSQHLLFGNPQILIKDPNGDYREQARKDIDTPAFSDNYFIRNDQEPSSAFRTNYLIEKPQYSFSYNDDTRTPNWVSYQLNKSWLGSYNKDDLKFQADPRLPFGTNKGLASKDIDLGRDGYNRGHMTARADRSRNEQDYYATFLMTNVLPQVPSQSYLNDSQWTKLEVYLRNLVNNHDKELYIIAGRNGQAIDASSNPLLLNNKISFPEAVWKIVLVLDHPSQGIYDVNKDTLAFGIYLPNTLDANGKGQDPNDDWTQNFTLNGTTFGLFNVATLERLTDYNFFSNIPAEIQKAIEDITVADIRARINPIEPAPLIAATDKKLSVNTVGTFFNSAIGHGSIPSYIKPATKNGLVSIGIPEISLSQISVSKGTNFSPSEISTNRPDMSHISPSQIGTKQMSIIQIGGEQISLSKNCFPQTSPTQIGSEQIGFSQISLTQIDIFKISTPQVNPPQVSTFESSNQTTNSISFSHFTDNANQLNSSKVTLPSVVTLQQFISSNSPNHNNVSNFLSNFQSSVTSIWSDLLKSETSLEINFQITDLPKGQLAEATITGFDAEGKPNQGTVLIDYNANGIGWFIDKTPLENAEFRIRNAEWAFQATSDSEAYGKYDLLTAILHETAHLYGFIDGYAPFEKHITWNNGTPVFIGDNFTATLTPDLDHLQTAHHPYDLLNTHLAPGIRKLPSDTNLRSKV
jgi:DNA/RNA endonuclease G (NUC1)